MPAIRPHWFVRGQIEGLYTGPTSRHSIRKGDRHRRKRWAGQRSATRARSTISATSCAATAKATGWSRSATASCTAGVSSPSRRWSTPEVIEALAKLVPLAPLHQPHNLAPIRILAQIAAGPAAGGLLRHRLPPLQPEVAQAYALPEAITARGVRRYGFHGLSYEYIAACCRMSAPGRAGRTVVAHLGNGASMCALRRPQHGQHDGLHRRRRPADGHALRQPRPGRDPVPDGRAEDGCARRRGPDLQASGLLGVSGISSDMRTLLASDDPRARFAVELFSYRIGRELGSLAAPLQGSMRWCSPPASASMRR
jgi:acetate kinase